MRKNQIVEVCFYIFQRHNAWYFAGNAPMRKSRRPGKNDPKNIKVMERQAFKIYTPVFHFVFVNFYSCFFPYFPNKSLEGKFVIILFSSGELEFVPFGSDKEEAAANFGWKFYDSKDGKIVVHSQK